MAKKRSFGKYLAYVLFVLVVITSVGVVAYFTNGFTTGFKTFYVTYNGKNIMANTQLELPVNEELRFDCKYTFGFLHDDSSELSYDVDLTSNYLTDNSFDFHVDDEIYAFNLTYDLSSVLNLTFYDSYFTIKIDKDILKIIEALYPDKSIMVDEDDYSQYYSFLMVISSEDGSSTISIEFCADVNVLVQEVNLDKGEILFE